MSLTHGTKIIDCNIRNLLKFTANLFPSMHHSKPKSNHNTWILKMLWPQKISPAST